MLLLLPLLRHVHRITKARLSPRGPARGWSDPHPCYSMRRRLSGVMGFYNPLPPSGVSSLSSALAWGRLGESPKDCLCLTCVLSWESVSRGEGLVTQREKNLLLSPPPPQEEKINLNQTFIHLLFRREGWLGTILKSRRPSHQEVSLDPHWVYEGILLSWPLSLLLLLLLLLLYWGVFCGEAVSMDKELC